MDKTDKRILEILQTDCRITNQELADKVALSPSPCLRRVKQLEQDGYIKQYAALLDPKKIGLELMIFVLLGLDNHEAKKMKNFQDTIQSLPQVIECYLIAGQSADYLLKVMVPNLESYHDFLLKELTVIPGVSNIHSSFVLNTISESLTLPLNGI